MTPQLTKSEFKTFVLIYAAYVDYNFSDQEEAYIKGQSSNGEYEKMNTLFKAHTDYQSLKIILEHRKKFYQSLQEKEVLYAQIVNLFKIDGEYSRPEKLFLNFLEQMITQANESESN